MTRPRLILGLSRWFINEEMTRLSNPDGGMISEGLRERVAKRVVDTLGDHEIIILDEDVNVGSVYPLGGSITTGTDIAVIVELDANDQITQELGDQIAEDLDTAVGRLIRARSKAAQLKEVPTHVVYVFVIDQSAEMSQA
jgi:hypothetical protein